MRCLAKIEPETKICSTGITLDLVILACGTSITSPILLACSVTFLETYRRHGVIVKKAYRIQEKTHNYRTASCKFLGKWPKWKWRVRQWALAVPSR